MTRFLQFITWPAIAGILAAIILLQWHQRTDSGAATSVADNNASYPAVSFAAAVQQAIPAVVNIYTSKLVREMPGSTFRDPFYRRGINDSDRRRERLQRSLGSGVIVSAQGLILTSRHIIADADEILVRLHDGRTTLAQVAGSDPDTDLAVLRIQLENIQPISFGKPDQARVGDVVLAIGNPYGFGHSVSQGIISALGRYGLQLSTYEDFIQTDAAINEGNSGGALIDTQGRLLGINTATFSRNREFTGIGLATPVDLAMGVAQDLVSFGKVIRGWMGLEVQTIFMTGSDLPSLLVTGTHPRGPAAHSGIREGDVITHIDMQPVVDGRVTMHQIALLRPGDAVDLTLRREGQDMKMKVVVGSRPESSGQ
ncbi:MAG: trypsin-like peptidase domain-containing protein [Halieaceae bacterium]